MYSVTLQLTKFTNINDGKVDKDSCSYGYRIYDSSGECSYCNAYSSLEELKDEIDEDSIVDFIKENHPEFYDMVCDDGGLFFNEEAISLNVDDDEYSDNDDTLLPDRSEMPNGEPKYVINIPEDDIKEVQEIIVEASDNLI